MVRKIYQNASGGVGGGGGGVEVACNGQVQVCNTILSVKQYFFLPLPCIIINVLWKHSFPLKLYSD